MLDRYRKIRSIFRKCGKKKVTAHLKFPSQGRKTEAFILDLFYIYYLLLTDKIVLKFTRKLVNFTPCFIQHCQKAPRCSMARAQLTTLLFTPARGSPQWQEGRQCAYRERRQQCTLLKFSPKNARWSHHRYLRLTQITALVSLNSHARLCPRLKRIKLQDMV